MPNQTPIVERAVQIARSGRCRSFEQLKRQLATEGHSAASLMGHLGGRAFNQQLRRLIAEAAVPLA